MVAAVAGADSAAVADTINNPRVGRLLPVGYFPSEGPASLK